MVELRERYEYYGRSGLTFTHWFLVETFSTKEEAEKYLEEYKKRSVSDKRKHEYQICLSK